METLYYMGNIINDLGRPYAIITIYEENDKVVTEHIVIFDSFREQTFYCEMEKLSTPKVLDITTQNIIKTENRCSTTRT